MNLLQYIHLDLILTTSFVVCLILVFALLGNYFLRRPQTLGYTFYMTIARSFIDMVEQSWNGHAPLKYYLIIASFFIFILTCNWVMLFELHEPTADYNTTLALALLSFLYIQKESLKRHGLKRYLGEYFKTPIKLSKFSWPKLPLILIQGAINTVIGCALLPLELMSKFSSILSLSFRLFGNILAGGIVYTLWTYYTRKTWYVHALSLTLGAPIHLLIVGFFGIFEGVIQAFVFTILTTTYLSLATTQSQEPTL